MADIARAKRGLTKWKSCVIMLIESEVRRMDWEMIWWVTHGGAAFVVLVLSLLITPKEKKDDITILRVGK